MKSPTHSQVFLEQIWLTTRANMLVRYRQSWSGFFWVVLNPLLSFIVQSYVFHRVLKLDIPKFHIFLLSGLLPWLFITQSLDICATTLVNNGRVTKAYPINPLLFIAAQILDNFINFAIVFSMILIWATGHREVTALQVIFAFCSMIPLLIAVASMAVFFSALHVLYRDVKFVLSFVLSLSFFLTPVFYPESFVPEDWRWVIDVNVLYKLLKPVRVALTEDPLVSTWSADFLVSCSTAAVFLVISFIFWKRRRNDIQLAL